jgi:hypothetical protein
MGEVVKPSGNGLARWIRIRGLSPRTACAHSRLSPMIASWSLVGRRLANVSRTTATWCGSGWPLASGECLVRSVDVAL